MYFTFLIRLISLTPSILAEIKEEKLFNPASLKYKSATALIANQQLDRSKLPQDLINYLELEITLKKSNDNPQLTLENITRYNWPISDENLDNLVKLGANIHKNNNSCFYDCKTPLMVAVQYNNFRICRYLLKNKVDVDAKSTCGNTVLSFAARDGQIEMIKLLLNYKACVNNRHIFYITPLLFACKENHYDCAKILLEHRANVNARDVNGQTALSIARDNQNKELIRLLKKYGAGNIINKATFKFKKLFKMPL